MRPSWSNGSPTSRIERNESGSAVRGQPLPGRQQTRRVSCRKATSQASRAWSTLSRPTSRPDIRSREMCTSVCCIGLIGRPPESCCWRRQARRPVDCQTSFDRGPSPKSTGPSWKDARASRKGNGSTGSTRTAEPTEPAVVAEESAFGEGGSGRVPRAGALGPA